MVNMYDWNMQNKIKNEHIEFVSVWIVLLVNKFHMSF